MFRKTSSLIITFTLVFAILISSMIIVDNFANAEASNDNSAFKNPEFIDLLDQIIEAEVLYGLSGAQLAVYKDNQLIKNSAYGYTNNYYNVFDENGNSILDEARALPCDERNKVTTDTLFDMASNTKMYATVFAMQKLVSEGKVSLDDRIKDIFPEFTDHGNENGWKDIITVEHVLSHYAGFAPDPQYHNENYDENEGSPKGENHLFSQDKEKTFEMVMKTSINTEPGTSWAYSDVDMMLAGFIIEHITGKDLDTYVKESFYNPLNLDKITFNPLNNGFNVNDTSSSELHGNTRDGRISFQNVRKEIISGEVHDEKAYYSMGGISGHAGLFGNARQVAYLGQAMFEGELEGKQFFSRETIDKFIEPASLLTQTNGGWRRKSETGGAAVWFSKFAPAGTIGHTGWTGTNTMIDMENRLTLALFTNSRNTPIMGPGADTFYTANSNVSSYGAVSEFIYRGLGFGTETPHEVLRNMIRAEIPEDLDGVSSSKRNVIRSLIHVLEVRTKDSEEAKEYLNSQKIQDIKEELQVTYAKDMKFLVVRKNLDNKLDEAKSIKRDNYTEESFNNLQEQIIKIENLLNSEYTQEEIDDGLDKLLLAISELKKDTEDPKDDEPKDEDPKDEDPKGEDPKDEDPKDEEPKDEDPKDEEPKDQEPKDEKKDEDLPATGQKHNKYILMIGAILILGGLGMFIWKKENLIK